MLVHAGTILARLRHVSESARDALACGGAGAAVLRPHVRVRHPGQLGAADSSGAVPWIELASGHAGRCSSDRAAASGRGYDAISQDTPYVGGRGHGSRRQWTH